MPVNVTIGDEVSKHSTYSGFVLARSTGNTTRADLPDLVS